MSTPAAPAPLTRDVRDVAQKYGLTSKQARFAIAYVNNGGNGVQSAKAAGYNGGESAVGTRSVELVQKSAVKAAIDGLIGGNVENYGVADVLRDLRLIKDDALEHRNHASAVKCIELHGKHIGMWKDSVADLGGIELVIKRRSPTIDVIDGELVSDSGQTDGIPAVG